MSDIQVGLQALLPSKRKLTPSGWTSFNAPCCHNRGETKDNRQRGGILLHPDGGFQYHCFNCNFKAGWSPGHLLTKNTKSLLKWLGMPDDEINKLILTALQAKDNQPKTKKTLSFELVEKQLPELSASLTEWASMNISEETGIELIEIFKYLEVRGMNIDWYPWHWSNSPGYKDRLLIPFYHEGKIVGYTGRKIREGKPKYLTDTQPGYVFNIDRQTYDRKYVIVVEGQFDAIAVDGVAIMHNEPNETQCARINSLGKEVIVVPDRDRPGAKLINAALSNNWSVSLPPWENDIKDVADAVKRYGRLYTLFTILHYKETNEIKIQLLKKKLETLNG
jgi:5S rRNA maturation endonuclease (ribonuclease M5)